MEIWKPIDDYDMYEVSNLGNVRNIKTNRLLKLNKATNGYYCKEHYDYLNDAQDSLFGD